MIVPEDISKSIKAHLVQFFSRSVEHHWILTALRTDQYIPDNTATVDPRLEEILSSPSSISREARNREARVYTVSKDIPEIACVLLFSLVFVFLILYGRGYFRFPDIPEKHHVPAGAYVQDYHV